MDRPIHLSQEAMPLNFVSQRLIRFPQDCFAIRGNAMARKSSMSRANFRASGIRIPNDSFGIRIRRFPRLNPANRARRRRPGAIEIARLGEGRGRLRLRHGRLQPHPLAKIAFDQGRSVSRGREISGNEMKNRLHSAQLPHPTAKNRAKARSLRQRNAFFSSLLEHIPKKLQTFWTRICVKIMN